MKKSRQGAATRKLARERTERLWKLSLEETRSNPELACQWMSSARRIAQKARFRMPPEMTRGVCKRCGAPLIPGTSSRVRMRGGRREHLAITCLRCGTIRRLVLRRED